MPRNSKKILVTGGAGFIGSHLVPLLLNGGHSVVVLDNLSTGRVENLDSVNNNANFTFVHGDIRNVADLRKSIKGADTIVHLAAMIDVAASVDTPGLTHEINVTGTINVLTEATKSCVERFVFASSTAVYGNVRCLPVRESDSLSPISPYAASKAACEAYCSAFSESYCLNAIALRFFNVYGPKNENSPYSGVITKFLRQVLNENVLIIEGDGKQTRDFIYISDVVKAITLAVETKKLSSKVLKICTGMPTSVNELVNLIHILTGRDLQVEHNPPRVGDIRFSYGDASRAFEELGFRANVSIAEGLRLMYAGACHKIL